jgi:phosphatidylserine/phosphatidylglycerophosphate/cardiolipin synthase-like enzyme
MTDVNGGAMTDVEMEDYTLYIHTVMFETKDIQARLLLLLKDPMVCYIVGCTAWLTNTEILMALMKKRCTIICNPPPYKSTYALYKQCNRYLPHHPAVICLELPSCARHNLKILMHHKFLIGLNNYHNPMWVLNGSFNFTNHALCNFENAIVHNDQPTLNLFCLEFQRILRLTAHV